MPFDATFLRALRQELEPLVVGCRIDKIQQPDRTAVLLSLHRRDFDGKLLLSASPSAPRTHFTTQMLENPAQPPMFCMLLRKYLTGAKIIALSQPPMERILDFTLECTDELGEKCVRHLYAELMGRNANLILCDAEHRIMDCIRRVGLDESEKHPVLPGLIYRLPPLAEKLDPFAATEEELFSLVRAVSHPTRAVDWLMDTFGGLSPLLAREVSFRVWGDGETDLFSIQDHAQGAKKLAQVFAAMARPRPYLFSVTGQPKDFSYAPIEQYGALWQGEVYPSFSRLLDAFYAQREHGERMRQKTASLRKTAQNLLERTCRKLEAQKQELSAATDREKWRQYGDLLTANLHHITRGQSSVTVENFYDPDMAPVTIPLSVTLSPQQNAARYYKQYQKAKTAEKILTEQIALATGEKEYLRSILEELSRAENEKDVLEIRHELVDGGYLRSGEKKRMKLPPSRPREFLSTDGFTILVGRNNRQNDELTLKIADKRDIWLHVQKLHGSHVILRCHGLEPTDTALTEAAMLAAYYSEAKDSGQVAVDVTEARRVKKPAGGKPGMVIYDNYRTLFVTPDPKLPARSGG